jgi:hypothetical protein
MQTGYTDVIDHHSPLAIIMTFPIPRTVTFATFAPLAALVFLTACGGSPEGVNPPPTTLAASTSITHMPVADCEPQGCHGLRIIDSNAETFRADAARRDALQQAVARLDTGASLAQ